MRRVSSPRALMSGMDLPLLLPLPNLLLKNFPFFSSVAFDSDWIWSVYLLYPESEIGSDSRQPGQGPLRKKENVKWSPEAFFIQKFFFPNLELDPAKNKVLTYIEYRAVSGVFRTIDPPLSTQRVCPPPAPKAGGGGVHTRRAVKGWGGQYFGRRQTLDWPLTV